MSNYPPGNDPLGTQPIQPGPTQQGPYGGPPRPPATKSKALFWILGGCGTVLVLGVLVVAGVLWWGYSKAKEAGLDPELMQKSPAMAAAKIMAAANPDIEVVSADEASEMITLRDKRSGETITISLSELRDGKITFTNPEGKEVVVDAQADAQRATIEMKSAEGTATYGTGGQADLPSWLPKYPGITPQGVFSAKSGSEVNGSFAFTTTDSVDQILAFYEDGLKAGGFKVNTNVMREGGQVAGPSHQRTEVSSSELFFDLWIGLESQRPAAEA
jgi:hypothetical protein